MEQKLEIQKDAELIKIISQVNYILSNLTDNEADDDSFFKYLIKIIFNLGPNSNKIVSLNAKETDCHKLIQILELIFKLSKYDKEKRIELYKTPINQIKDKEIIEFVIEIDSNYEDIYVENYTKYKIYSLIYKWMRKDMYTLSEYIEITILELSFGNILNDNVDKFQIYSVIFRKFLSQTNLKLNFEESAISLDDKSLELIINLLEKEDLEDETIILSLIVLKYDFIKEIIKDCNNYEIFDSIKNTCIEINNRYTINADILTETIIIIFCEEMDNCRDKKNKNNKKKRINKKKNKSILKSTKNKNYSENKNINKILGLKYENNNKESNLESPISTIEEKQISNNNNNNIQNNKILLEIFDFINNNNLGSKNIEEYKKYINKKINDLKNSKNMEKNEFSNALNDLQNIMLSLLNSNLNLKEKVSKLEGKASKLEGKVLKLEKEMDDAKEDIDSLKYENGEIKNILSSIQTRDLSKNFLRVFKKYLSPQDKNIIEVDESKMGEVISKRIEVVFNEFKKKNNFNLVKNLIKKASDILYTGNDLAHSLTLDYFTEEIKKYKDKKKLDYLSYQEIFCFLVVLGVPANDFDNCYNLLKKYFTKNLTFKSRSYDLNKIFD